MNKKEKSKLCGILAYILVGIIWYFVDEKVQKDQFAKFHVKQALMLLIVGIIASFAASILAFIPILGWLIIFVVQVALFVIWLMGLIGAIQGEKKKLPIIGEYAEKLLSF
ncbi:MAG: DUF4870 domain-containing protein [Nanobdellota archaeon]